MRRRDFITLLGGLPLWPLTTGAQPTKTPTVGFLAIGARQIYEADLAALHQGLRETSQIEGSTLTLEKRFADARRELVPELISDLMRQDVAVFVCPGPSAALAVRRATTKVPVVAVGLPPEPFPELFASHEKPAGSVTGFAHVGLDLAPARMQMLCELMPSAKKLAILYSRADDLCVAWRDQTSGAALRRGLTATSIGLTSTSVEKLKPLLQMVRSQGAEALVVVRDYITDTLQNEILRIAADLRMAVVAERRSFAEAGALLSYAASPSELYRGVATYVDKLLKGATAGELPIQIPTKFELVINLKIAKGAGHCSRTLHHRTS
jgi:ABC-type uncharacterized transport system substrate-binding protein